MILKNIRRNFLKYFRKLAVGIICTLIYIRIVTQILGLSENILQLLFAVTCWASRGFTQFFPSSILEYFLLSYSSTTTTRFLKYQHTQLNRSQDAP